MCKGICKGILLLDFNEKSKEDFCKKVRTKVVQNPLVSNWGLLYISFGSQVWSLHWMEIGKSRLNLLVTSSSNIIASDKWNYHFLDFVEFQETLVFLFVFNKKKRFSSCHMFCKTIGSSIHSSREFIHYVIN